jgi:hypothetical protein
LRLKIYGLENRLNAAQQSYKNLHPSTQISKHWQWQRKFKAAPSMVLLHRFNVKLLVKEILQHTI